MCSHISEKGGMVRLKMPMVNHQGQRELIRMKGLGKKGTNNFFASSINSTRTETTKKMVLNHRTRTPRAVHSWGWRCPGSFSTLVGGNARGTQKVNHHAVGGGSKNWGMGKHGLVKLTRSGGDLIQPHGKISTVKKAKSSDTKLENSRTRNLTDQEVGQ